MVTGMPAGAVIFHPLLFVIWLPPRCPSTLNLYGVFFKKVSGVMPGGLENFQGFPKWNAIVPEHTVASDLSMNRSCNKRTQARPNVEGLRLVLAIFKICFHDNEMVLIFPPPTVALGRGDGHAYPTAPWLRAAITWGEHPLKPRRCFSCLGLASSVAGENSSEMLTRVDGSPTRSKPRAMQKKQQLGTVAAS